MQNLSKNILLGDCDLDSAMLRVPANTAVFKKNIRSVVNKDGTTPTNEGDNLNIDTPFESSVPVEGITYPEGDCFTIGQYESKERNELYVFVYNSLANHFIYRIRGVDGVAQIVYQGACLNFQLYPTCYISEGRCIVRTDTYTDYAGTEIIRAFLIFTDNFNDQRCISIDDSIATNYFTTSYFNIPNAYKFNHCHLINLGVAPSFKCIDVQPIPRQESDKEKVNLMSNAGWQWRIKYIDQFGRHSEHGIISQRYFNSLNAACVQSSNGIARCVKLIIDAGNPYVEKIQIEFRKCNKSGSAGATDSDWFLYDTIYKYNNTNVPWYQRALNPDYTYNSGNNTFEYVFCNDKECQPIDPAETSRLFNPLPILSASVFNVDNCLGLSNNVRGFDKLKSSELNKLHFSVIPPTDLDCTNISRTIEIYAIIWNPYGKIGGLGDGNAAISVYNPSRFPNLAYPAGVIWGNAFCHVKGNLPQTYGQTLPDNQYGFIGYLAGTKYAAVSEQCLYDPITNQITVFGPVPDFADLGTIHDKIYIQRFVFDGVIPGKYSFRIAGHNATLQDNYQFTSTYTRGITSIITPGVVVNDDREMIINVCNANYINRSDMLMIWDLSFDHRNKSGDCTQWGRIVDGYVKEDRISNIPIELVPIKHLSVTGSYGPIFKCPNTDHNGFYFAGSASQTLDVELDIDRCFAIVKRTGTCAVPDNVKHIDLYAMDGQDAYPENARREISGKYLLCDNDQVGISGALVVMKYGQFAFTDENGLFKIIAHQRDGDYATAGDILIRSQRGLCVLTDCNDTCQTCFDDVSVPYKACGGGRNTDIGSIRVNMRGINKRGLTSGGRYAAGITIYDWMGRGTFIQAAPFHYIDIPSLINTKKFAFPTISYNMAGIVFPAWVNYMTFSITENLNNNDTISWVADSVQFIDDGGNINKVNPTKIRIYYASLNEYNKQNNFATNTNWQFITTDGNSVIGDYIEFITKNSKGDWFDKAITQLIRYDKTGTYFDINYTDELKDLEDGFLYRLVRPKQCLTQYIYHEICSTIRVTNGIPENTSGILDAFDSYFVSRQIPVPKDIKDASGQIVKQVTVKYYSYLFEHNGPSDFYGLGCANRGRINTKNNAERQMRLASETAISKSSTNQSSFNGLNYFDDINVKIFLEQEWGEIVAVIPDVNVFMFICAHDTFLCSYKDNIARLNSNNDIEVPGAAGGWGEPQRKVGNPYGCQMFDINTIRKLDNVVVFLDRNNVSLVFHDYSQAIDVSIKGFKGYLNMAIANSNRTNVAQLIAGYSMFIGGIDPKNKEYYLTSWFLPIPGNSPEYINNDAAPYPGGLDTLCIDLATGNLKANTAFVPEYYGSLEGYVHGKNMFSFKQGQAWSHRSYPNAISFNNFFGVQCKKVIEVVVNDQPEVVKKFLWMEVDCVQHIFIADRVQTEVGQTTHIHSSWFIQKDKLWCAPFLCDLNTFHDPNIPAIAGKTILEGDLLSGKWIRIRCISQPADDAKYCEVAAINVGHTSGDVVKL